MPLQLDFLESSRDMRMAAEEVYLEVDFSVVCAE